MCCFIEGMLMSELNACILDYQSLAPEDLDVSQLWLQRVGTARINWTVFDHT